MMPSSGLPQKMFLDVLDSVPTIYVALVCPLPVLLDRNRGREDRWAGLAESSWADFAKNDWHYDLVFNSDALRPDVLVRGLRTALSRIA